MITQYKDYSISVKKDKNAPPERSFVAYINDVANGREHTRGSSEEDAIEELKHRIDNFSIFNQMYLAPLSDKEKADLECYIKIHAKEICSILKKEHHIFPGRFIVLTAAAIYNHYKLIEKIMCSEGECITLDIACLKNKEDVSKVVLFSTEYYNSQKKIIDLENALRMF